MTMNSLITGSVSILLLMMVKSGEGKVCYSTGSECEYSCSGWHYHCEWKTYAGHYCCERNSAAYGAAIFGIILAVLIVGGVIACITCWFCAWCPWYQRRHQDRGPQVQIYQPAPQPVQYVQTSPVVYQQQQPMYQLQPSPQIVYQQPPPPPPVIVV